MTKIELQEKVDKLETTLNSVELNAKVLKDDLIEAQKKLADISKPKLYPSQIDELREAVHQAVQQISFDNIDSYSYDFEIEYDNQLRLSNIEFDGESDLEECICDYVEDCFNVIDAEDE